MKSGYYIIPRYCTENDRSLLAQNVGIMNKIEMQIKEFSKEFEMTALNIYRKRDKRGIEKIFCRLPFTSEPRDYRSAFERIEAPYFIYVRNCPPIDKEYIAFLRSIKKKYRSCKVIVEIPTFPYDNELFSLPNQKPLLYKDRIYREKYKEFVDRFVVFSKEEYVFGVKTINVMNGINVNDVTPLSAKKEFNKNEINLIFVGTMRQHHGLERLILGLSKYYEEEKKVKILAHFVGDGPERSLYEELTNKYDLQQYIKFYGKKEGNELDDLYNKSDIALNSFGMYKLGLNWLSSIKSREYIAKGMPMINGCETDVFVRYPCDFCIDFSNNESIIDIDRIVKWYDGLIENYKTPYELVQAIRNYAVEHVDNSVVLKPIIEYLLSDSIY